MDTKLTSTEDKKNLQCINQISICVTQNSTLDTYWYLGYQDITILL